MRAWKLPPAALIAAVLGAAAALPAAAQAPGTQFIGITGYRVGPNRENAPEK
jgi:hypothetical protein